ncbi:flippase [Shewanella sp. 10N.286.54.B9]|uniref:flippase n=1 Tax=Shewanella sp. 10N.286.54.B9 TaxID=3229719 RepID=UPI0035517103
MRDSTPIYKRFFGTAGLMLLSKAMVMVIGVLFANHLGPEQFGLYSLALSIVALSTLPVVAGLPNLLVREVANFHSVNKWDLLEGVTSWSRLYVIGISTFVVFTLYTLLYFDFFEPQLTSLLWIAGLLIPLRGLLTQQSAILNGLNFPVLAQLPVQVLIPAITLGVFCFYFLLPGELESFDLLCVSIFACLFSCVISMCLLNRKLNSNVEKVKPKKDVKVWLTSLMPFAIMAFITTLNTELASVLLGLLVDNESVAFFKVATQAVALITLGLTAVNVVIMPNIARLYKNNDLKATQELLTKSVRLSVVITLPIIVVLVLFGEYFIDLLFGNDYVKSYPILVILCIGQLVNVLMGSVGLLLNMTGNENRTLRTLLITFVVNIVLFSTLIPIFGGIGAAISISLSLITWNVLMTVDAWRITKLKPWIR